MPKFSKQSRDILSECHGDIRTIMYRVIETFDISITEGYRGEKEQNKAYREGLSQLQFPESKHNQSPSMAVHAIPYPFLGWDNTAQFVYMAGYIVSAAYALYYDGVIRHKLRWGGNWDMDGEVVTDQGFDDLAHFELVKPGE